MIHVTNVLGLWSLVGITTLPLLIGTAALLIERYKIGRILQDHADSERRFQYRAWSAQDDWKM